MSIFSACSAEKKPEDELTNNTPEAPSSCSYLETSSSYSLGVAITANTISCTQGSAVLSYEVVPSLPAGLVLNSTTGEISGTPTAPSELATYMVTARNAGGSGKALFQILVRDLPPALSYSGGAQTYVRTHPVAMLTPSSTGGTIVSCSSNPVLPAGLVLSSNCGLSGTPTAVAASAVYTITGTNSGGSANATLTIQVNDVPPLAMSPSTIIIPVNTNTPFTATGGVTPYSYSVVSGVGTVSGAGVYTSGTAGSATVRVTDAESHFVESTISIYTPGQITLCPGAKTSTSSGGTFFDSGGSLGSYQNNENCSLLIQPSANAGAPLTLSFTSFSLDVDHDLLKVYDGTNASGIPLHPGNGFTGTNVPHSVIATSGALFIVMTTDASIVSSGFQASWSQTPVGTPVASFTASGTNVAVNSPVNFTDTSSHTPTTWAWDFNNDGINLSSAQNPTFTFTTEGKKTVRLTASNSSGLTSTTKEIFVGMKKMCTDTLSNSLTGVLFDSGRPTSDYSLNENCAILIQPPGGPSPGMITLHFNNFSTETSAHWVEVYDGTSASGIPLHPSGGFTGQKIPNDIFAISGSVYIVMKTATGIYSGDNRTHSGFEATWSSSPPGSPGADFTLSTTVAAIGQSISLTDISSNSPSSWEWSFANPGIVDSTQQNPTVSYPSSGVYTIQLKVTNAFGTSLRKHTVFVGSYDKMCAAGNHTVSSTSLGNGILYDSGGPGANYGDQEDCGFLIQPASATSITLTFSSFDLEDTYDFVEVFDGTNASGVPLHVNSGYSFGFTGQSMPPSVTATSGAMYIRFTSDQLVNRTGFSANWSVP